MKLNKLLELLGELPSNLLDIEVIVPSDEEGNSYHTLEEPMVAKMYIDCGGDYSLIHPDDECEYELKELKTVIVMDIGYIKKEKFK